MPNTLFIAVRQVRSIDRPLLTLGKASAVIPIFMGMTSVAASVLTNDHQEKTFETDTKVSVTRKQVISIRFSVMRFALSERLIIQELVLGVGSAKVGAGIGVNSHQVIGYRKLIFINRFSFIHVGSDC